MSTNRLEDLIEFYEPVEYRQRLRKEEAEKFLYEPVAERKAMEIDYAKSVFDDDELWKKSVGLAIREANQSSITDKAWVQRRAEQAYSQGKAKRNLIDTDERIRLRKAIKQGAMIKPEDVRLNEEQRKSLADGRGYKLTAGQVKRQMLLDGDVPEDILPHFTERPGDLLLEDPKIPEEMRIEMQERMDTLQRKPPGTREAPSEARNPVGRFFVDIGVGILDVLGSGGRFAQGLPAGYMRGLREREQLRAQGKLGARNIESVKGKVLEMGALLDDAISGGFSSMLMLNDAPELAEELGYIAHSYWEDSVKQAIENKEPGDTREVVQAKAENIYQRRLKSDDALTRLALRYPAGGQLATEILADPLNILGGTIFKGAAALTTKAVGKERMRKAGAAVRQAPVIKQVRSVFVKSIDNDETIRELGDFGDSIRRSVKAAEDAGGAASRKVRVIGGQIDELLSKASEKRTLTWKTGDKTEEITESQALFRVLDTGVGIDNLPKNLRPVVGEVKKLSDELYDMSARRGMLNKVVGGTISTAGKVLNYVPYRNFEGIGNLEEKVKAAGFASVTQASEAVRVSTLRDRAAQVERAIGIKKRSLAKASASQKDDIIAAIDRLENRKAALNDEFARMNDRLANAGGIDSFIAKGMKLDKPTRRLIHQLQMHASKVDMVGANGSHRIDPTSWAAVAREGGAQPIENARMQWRDHIRREANVAGRAAEVAALTRMFGKELSDLRGAKLVHVKPSKGGTKLNEEIAALSEETGLHYSYLSPDLKQAYLQLAGKAGDPVRDAEVILPKAMAARLNEILPKLSDGGVNEAAGLLKDFNDYILQPANSVFRTNTTVLRSLAFHGTNLAGAVGLGILAHGVKAANPRLQWASSRAASVAAFSGDEAALGMKLRLGKSGEETTLGELYKVMDEYGVIGQSGLRFGADLTVGKGVGATYAGFMQKVASKTRMQQVAALGDDYQKSVAFLGYMMRKGSSDPQDVYKALDFTTEYAGNYNRMTSVEKGYLRDIFAFYSWNRFILPHLVKQVYKNPQRLAAFEKLRMAAEYQYGKEQPVAGVGIPDHMRLAGAFQAPAEFQPGQNNSGSHSVAMMQLEFPIAGLGALAPGFGGGTAVEAQLGPGGMALSAMLSGFDARRHQAYTSEEYLPSLDDLEFDSMDDITESLFRVTDSKLGSQMQIAAPFGESMLNLSKLYMRHGMTDEAYELWLRYRVGRDWMGIDRGVARGLNFFGVTDDARTDLSIGSVMPGKKLYLVDPIQTAKRRKARAVEGLR